MEKTTHRLVLIFLAIAVMLSACASHPPQAKTTIQAVEFLNPNIYNQASPVVVTIYQLKSPTTFEQANFFALSNNAQAVLGADLLDKREIEIRPHQKQSLKTVLSTSANYIGVIAAFRDPDTSQWRAIKAIRKPGKDVSIHISLDAQNISLKVS
jgi:type VI secretion system protein VasD